MGPPPLANRALCLSTPKYSGKSGTASRQAGETVTHKQFRQLENQYRQAEHMLLTVYRLEYGILSNTCPFIGMITVKINSCCFKLCLSRSKGNQVLWYRIKSHLSYSGTYKDTHKYRNIFPIDDQHCLFLHLRMISLRGGVGGEA